MLLTSSYSPPSLCGRENQEVKLRVNNKHWLPWLPVQWSLTSCHGYLYHGHSLVMVTCTMATQWLPWLPVLWLHTGCHGYLYYGHSLVAMVTCTIVTHWLPWLPVLWSLTGHGYLYYGYTLVAMVTCTMATHWSPISPHVFLALPRVAKL